MRQTKPRKWLQRAICLCFGVFLMATPVFSAEDSENPVKNMIAGSFLELSGDHPRVLAGVFMPVISYRSLNLDVGAIGDITQAKTMLGLSVDIRKLSEEWGLEYHLDDRWRVGAYGHYSLDEDELNYGFYVGSKIF